MKQKPDQDDDANDLLGILLAANRKELRGTRKDLSLSIQGIVDECKLFFFAGHETTATLLTWTAMLLSIYPEWQEKARNEVSANESHLNSYESLHSLKIVSFPETLVVFF
jgi:cytochrome P450